MKKTILYIVVLFSLSCQTEQSESNMIEYFDTEVFVEKETKSLSKKNLKAKKEITLNGEKEILEDIKVDSLFLYQEFNLFRDANINKPALLGFYDERSVQVENFKVNEYAPVEEKESKFKTKYLSLVYNMLDNDNLQQVGVIVASENFMHSYNKEFIYILDKEIKIKAWEKTLFQDTMFYETKITFK